jgi:hypothetical protein
MKSELYQVRHLGQILYQEMLPLSIEMIPPKKDIGMRESKKTPFGQEVEVEDRSGEAGTFSRDQKKGF